MSTLVVDQLTGDPLEQEITLDTDLDIAGFKPVVMLSGMPAGSFSFNFYSGATLIKSYTFTAASVQAAIATSNNYFWAHLALPGDLRLTKGTYTIKLEATGYTYAENSFVSWVKDWQKLRPKTTGTPSDFTEYPYAYNLIEYVPREF